MGISTVVDYDLKAIQNQHLKSWIEESLDAMGPSPTQDLDSHGLSDYP